MGAANGYAFPQHMAGNAIMAILQVRARMRFCVDFQCKTYVVESEGMLPSKVPGAVCSWLWLKSMFGLCMYVQSFLAQLAQNNGTAAQA